MLTLGIETSCDETSVALLKGTSILADRIYTQTMHEGFGGVVPEIASRAHIRKIDALCDAVVAESRIDISEIDLIAVTDGPGLAGALLVGISFALGLHCARGIPITGVHHLDGHISAIALEYPALRPPFLALVVSGGHTALYTVLEWGVYALLGQTIDDAAGEAFDKVGKMLGFSYPAGRAIEECARHYGGGDLIAFPRARLAGHELDFSFSGLKTAVKYFLADKTAEFLETNKARICASFQLAVVEALTRNVAAALRASGLLCVAVVGGVACNGALRAQLRAELGETSVFFPSPKLCTDNAAMIAMAGQGMALGGRLRFPSCQPSRPL
ncbi:MAG: tRNA (adenosine(37)-N6)-threonylcarbamoyltransferase complex transferase subunit TsaD [Chitinivibrionales bacterium]|nr:tRNA (adenosine(37)-N6)-threonylcarbamoyltransferase complex transferase subunit TsaD [Chitinivibrionales bacterium]